MKRMFFGLLSSFLIAGAASAQEFKAPATVIDNQISYDVRRDGTHTSEELIVLRIDTDQGIKAFGQMKQTFSTSLQELQVGEAYTTTREGKRIDVAPAQILTQQSPESANAPMFDDAKVMTVVFPAVEVGSVLTVRWKRQQKVALFPGHFSAIEHMPFLFNFQSFKLTVRAPADLKLHVEARGVEGGAVKSDTPGTQLFVWTKKDVPARAQELGAVSYHDVSPHVAVTTFPDAAAAGRAYSQRAKQKAAVTPAIQSLANQITQGLTDRRAQAEALYRWVSSNVRYVAIFFNFGGVVPHAADEIAKAKYGDCKDHTTLLEALLAAKGIKSSAVLIDAMMAYQAPGVAALPGAFNHAITYVPEFDLYLDSTSGLTHFGALPPQLYGKPALIVEGEDGAGRLVTLPLTDPASNRMQIVTTMTIDEQGTVVGRSEITAEGALDSVGRQIFFSIPPGVAGQLASQLLVASGQQGEGGFKHGDPRDLSQPFVLTTHFNLPNYMVWPGNGALVVPAGLTGFTGIRAALDPATLPNRTMPMPLLNRAVGESITIKLPQGFKAGALPRPAKVEAPFGTYQSSYSLEKDVLKIERTLTVKAPYAVMPSEDYPAFRNFANAIARDLRAPLTY